MRLLYPECDHIVLAYKHKKFDSYHDHGEYGAGVRVLDTLNQSKMFNTALFVGWDSDVFFLLRRSPNKLLIY